VFLLFAATAHAAPVTLAKDLDGDGNADSVSLSETGELAIETKRGKVTLKLGPIKRASLAGGVVHGAPMIVVRGETEGIVIQGPAWKQVAKTQLGGVGLDADYSVALDVVDGELYRYQARAGFARCDDRPSLLFAERYEAGKFVPAGKLPIGLPANAPAIAARIDSGAAEPAIFKARAASYQPGAPDAGALAIPQELDDGKPTTARANAGDWYTFRARSFKAAQIRIVPAAKGAHPQRLAVFGAHNAWRVDLPQSGAAFVADLPAPVEGCVTIAIESGTGALAELEVFAEGERTGGAGALLAKQIADDKDVNTAAKELARLGAAAIPPLEAELAKATDPAVRARLVRALVENHDPAAGPLMARAAGEGWAHGPDLIALVHALSALGQPQALYDLAVKSAVPIDTRIEAIHALHPNTNKDRELLVALAGRGPRVQRQAVIEQLSDVPVAVLAPAAQAATKASAAGDLYRAITRRAHAVPVERAPALAALSTALPTASDYERRYRLVDGIAAVGDQAALQALGALLAQWPKSHETAAFKQVVARAIAVNRRPEAFDLALALVRDVDPGVRIAALSALAGTGGGATGGGSAGPWHGPSGPDGTDRVLVTSLATDTWPEVRRFAAQLLGPRCTRPGPAHALADSVARDPDLDVRGDALASLVDCKASGAGELLEKLWNDSKAPLPLRQRAIDLAVPLADASLGKKLVAKFTRWRREAIDSEPALALVQNAARAIGMLAAAGAVEALADGLDDAAFPEIVAASAMGLSFLGPACPAAVKPRLQSLATSDDQQVNVAAKRALERCGQR